MAFFPGPGSLLQQRHPPPWSWLVVGSPVLVGRLRRMEELGFLSPFTGTDFYL